MQSKQTDPYLIHVLEIIGNAVIGGVEKHVLSLVQHLPSMGYKVTCVAPYESSMTALLREMGSIVYITHMNDEPPWRSIQYLTELVQHQKIDLIHSHLPKAQILGGLVGALTNTPRVMTVHGMDISSWELGIMRTTKTRLNVVCQMAYAQALALGVPPDQVQFIPNGVDTNLFKPESNATTNCASVRKALNLPSRVPLVGFVGRLSFEKGPDMFVQLAQHIHFTHPEVHFVMVGDGPMRPELEKQIERSGLQDHLHLAGSQDNMHEIYPIFDVLVLTSRVEGMPYSLLEAMSCEIPVAAMNAGGVLEVVEVGVTGYLAALGDWTGLGDAVIKLLENPALRKKIGRAARQRLEQKFDLNSSLEMLSKEFRVCLNPNYAKREVTSETALAPKNL